METHSKTGTDAISKLTRNCNLFCPPSVLVGNEWRCNMFKNFRHSEGHGSRGLGQQARWYCRPLGDCRSHRISKDDPKAGGRQHLIWIDWVDYVDQKVHLNKPATKATSEWQAAA